MATSTTYLSLIKPEVTDTTKIREDFNTNMDTLDGRFSTTYLAVQDKNAVTITGGSITGITDLAIADGGTGASTSTAAFDALAPTTTTGDIIYSNGTNNVRLAKGTNGYFLKIGASIPEWVSVKDYTNLTSFVDQTAWRVFYSNTAGDVTELAFGTNGQYLKSNGATSAPTWTTPAGAGDVLKVGTPSDNQVGVWTGDGIIEGDASLTYDRSNLQLTGDIGSTGTKITKGWFTNLEITNAPTVNGSALSSANLSDVTTIAMLDETETVTASWTFTNNIGINKLSDTASAKAHVAFRKKRVTGDDVASGDYLGSLLFYGYHTNGYDLGATIRAIVDATPGDGDMPSRLEFLTSPDGSATPLKVMSMHSVASAVNYLKLTNAATSENVILEATGSDTNVSLDIDAKNTGEVNILSNLNVIPESQYPTQDADHVKATTKISTLYWAYFATDPTLSLTGQSSYNSWVANNETTNQRFHIDLGSLKIIKRIYYENMHGNGANTNRGIQNFTFWGSNTGAGTFDDLVYGNDEGWTELTVAQNTFDQHIAANQADPKYITVTNTIAYRYFAFKFADDYGGTPYMGVRRIELQTAGEITTSKLTATNIFMTGELDITGVLACIDLNPAQQTTKDIISIIPTATLNATQVWCGININGAALDPNGVDSEIIGYQIDFSGIDETNFPIIHGARLEVPFGQDALHIKEGQLHIDTTLPSTAASEFTNIDIVIDSSALVSTSEYHAIDVATTGTPSGNVVAIGTHFGVEVIHQHISTFTTPSQTEFAGIKHTNGTVWVDGIDAYGVIFVDNSDAIYVGSVSQFDEIEVIMTTGGTKSIQPTFWYNTAADTWTQFFPADDTDGFQQSGEIRWEAVGISATWTGDGDPGVGETTAGYWIKIVRTRAGTVGSPDPTTIKIGGGWATGANYSWGKTGDLTVKDIDANDIDAASLVLDSPLAIAEGGTGVTTGAMTNITSVLNTALYIGRDADNQIKFATDNNIIFRINGADGALFGSTGELDMGAHSVGFTLQTATGDGTTDIDWTLGNHFKFTFGAQADTLTFTSDPTNPCHLYLIVKQDNTGGRDLTFPGSVTWLQTEPTWTDGGANKVIIVGLVWDGTTYWAGATKWEA